MCRTQSATEHPERGTIQKPHNRESDTALRCSVAKHAAPGASIVVQVSSPSGGSAGKLMLAGEGGVRLPFGQVRGPAETGPVVFEETARPGEAGGPPPSPDPTGRDPPPPSEEETTANQVPGVGAIAQTDTPDGSDPERYSGVT